MIREEEDGMRAWRSSEDGGGSGELEMRQYEALPEGPGPGEFVEAGDGRGRLGIPDLDVFFRQIYHYHSEKGLLNMSVRWAAELFTFGFTISFSGFLLLSVNWHAVLHCGSRCDLATQGLHRHPLHPLTPYKAVVLLYLVIFTGYWLLCFFRFLAQLRDNLDIRRFCHTSLGLRERELQRASWPEVVQRLVELQARERLCVVRHLSAHDIVSRIMRRENYLIGMLSQGVIALPLPGWVPGAGPFTAQQGDGKEVVVLTKTLEWSLNWCILHHMYDTDFLIRRDFTRRPDLLRRRLQALGCVMLLLSPFIFLFMLMYFLMKNGEQFYHRPSTAGFRHWSNLARWTFREFNELEHSLKQRLDGSYKHALEYLKHFPPSPTLVVMAKVVSYVAGAFAMVLLGTVLLHETVLQAPLFGHELGWYVAVFGTVCVLSRSLITDEFHESDPETALLAVAQHTHFMPPHWRAHARSDLVRAQFQKLFQFRVVEFLEEMASIFTTPFILCFLLPRRVDQVLHFVHHFTTHIDGVGHVCSLSVFDGTTHPQAKDDKMDKSMHSFRQNYPTWMPHSQPSAKPLSMSDYQDPQEQGEEQEQELLKVQEQEDDDEEQGMMHKDHVAVDVREEGGGELLLNVSGAKEVMDPSRWWARVVPDSSSSSSMSLFPDTSKFEPPVFGVADSSGLFATVSQEVDKWRGSGSGSGSDKGRGSRRGGLNDSLLYKHS